MKVARALLLALLTSLLLGLLIGTVIRLRLERPVRYIGSALASPPREVCHVRAAVLDPRQHEQQVG